MLSRATPESVGISSRQIQKYLELLGKGVWNIFFGFFYKFILAYAFGTLILPVVSKYALGHGGISWWLVAYMYVYAMDLFFDFAGYSIKFIVENRTLTVTEINKLK